MVKGIISFGREFGIRFIQVHNIYVKRLNNANKNTWVWVERKGVGTG